MAVSKTLDARAVAEQYVELIQGDPDALELWFKTICDYPKLWLITRPLAVGEAAKFYGAVIQLRDRTGQYIDISVLDPSMYGGEVDLHEELPRGAQRIWSAVAE